MGLIYHVNFIDQSAKYIIDRNSSFLQVRIQLLFYCPYPSALNLVLSLTYGIGAGEAVYKQHIINISLFI